MNDEDDWGEDETPEEESGTKTTDLYGVLGIKKDATTKEIKSAYRKMAKMYHPDNKKTGNVDAFNLIQQAYDVLIDSVARETYDETGEIGKGRSRPPEDKSEVYELILGFFEQAVEAAGGRYKQIDLLDVTNQLIEQSMSEGHGNIDRANVEANKIRDIMTRMSFKGEGFNPIKRAQEQRLDSLHDSIKSITKAIEYRKEALEFLKNYKYYVGVGGNNLTPAYTGSNFEAFKNVFLR